jgi:hypothetical protein
MADHPALAFAREFLGFLRTRKRFWLLPLLVILVLMALLVFLTQGPSAAPQIYRPL